MNVKITALAIVWGICSEACADVAAVATAGSGGNVSGTATGSMPSVTNNPPASASPPTNYPPGQLLTNNPPPSSNMGGSNVAPGYNSFAQSNNNSTGYVPPGYTNPFANYTNPYYNYTNPHWAAHNTNSAGGLTPYSSTNHASWNMGTNASGISNSNNMPAVRTNRQHWWKFW